MSRTAKSRARALSFVEVSTAGCEPGIHFVVLHYSDGTRRDERFTCRRQFERRLGRLEASIRAKGQQLVPMAAGVHSTNKDNAH